ncbi:MAG TPA: hypothetical protein VLK33_05210 [Terriglobales bacterium]|nr:hypothetical protein [Terriglobales bacterium]
MTGFPPSTAVTINGSWSTNWFHNWQSCQSSIDGGAGSYSFSFTTDSAGNFTQAPGSEGNHPWSADAHSDDGTVVIGGVTYHWHDSANATGPGCNGGNFINPTYAIVGDYITRQIVGTSHLSGTLNIPPHSTHTHTVSLYYQGALVGTETTPVTGNAPYTARILANITPSHNGDTWTFVVDGTTLGGDTVALVNLGSIEFPNWVYSGSATANVTDSSPPATPTPPPTPNPTMPPTGSTPPPTTSSPPTVSQVTAPGGGTVNSGHVTVDNPADIYTPIADKLTVNGTADAINPDLQPADLSDDGHTSDVTSALTTITSQGATMRTSANNINTAIANKASSLTSLSFGDCSSFDVSMPSGWNGNWSHFTWHLDLTPFATGITIFRGFAFFCLSVTFFTLTARALSMQ